MGSPLSLHAMHEDTPMYIYACVCIYTYIRVCIYISVYMCSRGCHVLLFKWRHTYIFICMYVCIYTYIYVYDTDTYWPLSPRITLWMKTHLYTYICVWMCVHITCVCVYTFMYTCVAVVPACYAWMKTHLHTNVCVCKYTYIYVCVYTYMYLWVRRGRHVLRFEWRHTYIYIYIHMRACMHIYILNIYIWYTHVFTIVATCYALNADTRICIYTQHKCVCFYIYTHKYVYVCMYMCFRRGCHVLHCECRHNSIYICACE